MQPVLSSVNQAVSLVDLDAIQRVIDSETELRVRWVDYATLHQRHLLHYIT